MTTITFTLLHEDSVHLAIFNLMGQRVRLLLDHELPPGQYNIVWDGEDEKGQVQPSGIYFYKFEANNTQITKKMVLLK